jgi:hypothetical protein
MGGTRALDFVKTYKIGAIANLGLPIGWPSGTVCMVHDPYLPRPELDADLNRQTSHPEERLNHEYVVALLASLAEKPSTASLSTYGSQATSWDANP